ncbi:MAG: hypothetical protein ABR604_05325 [Jatrophihabitantaceae bacterium]
MTLSDGTTTTVPIDSTSSNQSAHYTIVYASLNLPAGTTVTDATAVVPSSYANNGGKLVLSHCETGTPSSSSGSSSSGSSSSVGAIHSVTPVVTPHTSGFGAAGESTSNGAAGGAGGGSGPIPNGVNAGRHAVSSTPVLLGALLMLAGAGGLLMALRTRTRAH